MSNSDIVRPRNPDGTFTDGQPSLAPPSRRQRGSPNKIPANVKNWLIEAACKIGADGNGANGGPGFCEAVGRQYPELLLAALVKLLPPAKEPELEPVRPSVNKIEILPVAKGHFFLTPDQMARATGIRPVGDKPVLVALKGATDDETDQTTAPTLDGA